jgi:nitrous oxidase accessory protein
MKYIFLIGVLVLNLLPLAAKTYRVGNGGTFKSIKQAMQAAKDGDTILVSKGMYKESPLLINKALVLLGETGAVLDGEKKYEVVSIKASGVTFKGFRVQHSGHASLDDPGGIKVYNCRDVVIEDNVLYDNFFGIYLQHSRACTIKHNQVEAFGLEEHTIGNGIHCWKSDSLKIIGNRIKGHRDGIYFEFVEHSIIWRNISKGNIRYGLHFMFSNNDAYITNYFANNGAGVAVMFTKHVTMLNNTFAENWGDAAYGLLLKEISDCLIEGNHFTSNTSGIYMEGVNRAKILKNVFSDNGWGLKIQASCMDNTLKFNNFYKNTFDVSTNGSLVLNIFEQNYWDKYEGYDLDKDGIGDVPFHPLSLFGVIAEQNPSAMLLFRSFMITLLDRSERVMPSITPDNFIDQQPLMHSIPL